MMHQYEVTLSLDGRTIGFVTSAYSPGDAVLAAKAVYGRNVTVFSVRQIG